MVFSYQNVTVIIVFKKGLNPSTKPRRPRFSFSSLFNCQKTDHIKQSKNHPNNHTSQTLRPNPKAALATLSRSLETLQRTQKNQASSRTSDFVASSAAALVSDRGYRSHLPIRQQTMLSFCRKNDYVVVFV